MLHQLNVWFPTQLLLNDMLMLPQVIQKCCHGCSPTSCQEETLFFSLPVSMETHSDDRDSVEQVSQRKALWEAGAGS